MGDVQEELRLRALDIATASHDRAQRRDFGARSVHAIRAGAKRLRALWQLLRPVLPEGVAPAANARLRDSNRVLATARDAHVARKTIEKLMAKCERGKDRKALQAFRDTYSGGAAAVRSQSDAVGIAGVYREEAAAWRELGLTAPDQAVIYSGIRRSYRKGRTLAQTAIAGGEPGDYHRWRKWVKYLLYQLEALEPRLLDWQRHHVARLERLGDALGKYNDLQNLRQSAESRTLPPRLRARVCAIIDYQALRIRRRCHRLQENAYRARPEIFAASVARAVSAPERLPYSLVSIAGE